MNRLFLSKKLSIFCGALALFFSAILAGSLKDNNDGTVADLNTGYIWQKCPAGLSGENCQKGNASEMEWPRAFNYCKNLKLAQKKWRLPWKNELKTLIYCSNGHATPLDFDEKLSPKNFGPYGCGEGFSQPTIQSEIFPNTGELAYWTSSPYKKKMYWNVYFGTGLIGHLEPEDTAAVRCIAE